MTQPGERSLRAINIADAGTLKAELAAQARDLGFPACGVTAPVAPGECARQHQRWLEQGYHTGMGFLARRPTLRYDACSLLPDCACVVVLAHSYAQRNATEQPRAKIARYAWGDDYHDVISGKLEALAVWLAERVPGLRWKATVDTSPLAEKAFAVQAGLGWRGKHSLVVNARLGSYFFIGCLLLNIELPLDAPVLESCGDCRRCIDACPTGALVAPGVLDAGRCISYHNTYRKGGPATDARLAGWLFGCDDCQLACPYNEAPLRMDEPRFALRGEIMELTPAHLLGMPEAGFCRDFAGTALAAHGYTALRGIAEVLVGYERSGD